MANLFEEAVKPVVDAWNTIPRGIGLALDWMGKEDAKYRQEHPKGAEVMDALNLMTMAGPGAGFGMMKYLNGLEGKKKAFGAIRTADGKILQSTRARNHLEIAQHNGVKAEDILDSGFVIDGKYVKGPLERPGMATPEVRANSDDMRIMRIFDPERHSRGLHEAMRSAGIPYGPNATANDIRIMNDEIDAVWELQHPGTRTPTRTTLAQEQRRNANLRENLGGQSTPNESGPSRAQLRADRRAAAAEDAAARDAAAEEFRAYRAREEVARQAASRYPAGSVENTRAFVRMMRSPRSIESTPPSTQAEVDDALDMLLGSGRRTANRGQGGQSDWRNVINDAMEEEQARPGNPEGWAAESRARREAATQAASRYPAGSAEAQREYARVWNSGVTQTNLPPSQEEAIRRIVEESSPDDAADFLFGPPRPRPRR